MSKRKIWLNTLAALAGVLVLTSTATACLDDATILIDRALNSPTLTVRYSGVAVTVVELKVNGASFGKRTVNASKKQGETTFTVDLSALNDGDNEVEVVLIDKTGKVVGTEKSIISTDEGTKGPVYLSGPKMGATVTGPAEIRVGFGKEMRNVYVSFFIDNQFRSMSNNPPFNYVWDTAREANGWHEVEAWVVDDTSQTFKTRKLKIFINNPTGRTYRNTEPAKTATTPAAQPAKTTSTPVANPTTLAPKTVAGPAIPADDLKVAANGINATAGVEAAMKAVSDIAAAPINTGAATVTSAPNVAVGSPAGNPFTAKASGARDIKSSNLAPSLSTGPKYLRPTGTRVAYGPPAPNGTGAPAGKSENNSRRTIDPRDVRSLTELPLPTAAIPTKSEKPKTSKVMVANPITVSTKVETLPSRTAVAAGSTNKTRQPGIKPVIEVSAPTTVKIDRGTRLPEMGSFKIRFENDAVDFDVQPTVLEGIPLTPFRHLFEKAGGEVKWIDAAKQVQALGEGREIYIQIGDKIAKVNKIPVELELAPFITNGRTIVPLSFLRSSLDVEIDYDPKTNHVLITKVKNKAN